uniref:STAS domain-containing protein n=1 Tax=Chenopodium quinoa TaxID=63459 RepID=A0A803NCX6_CHEQI
MASKSKIKRGSRVPIPSQKPFATTLTSNLKETFFPDDPFRKWKKQPFQRRLLLGLQYFVPIFEWAPRYQFKLFKADLIAGITIASLAIPQGINSSLVPPLVYAMMGSSRDLAIGTVAVASLLYTDILGKVVSPTDNPREYLHLAFTATFFTGVIQVFLGLLRLGFIVDLLSHATILGFMGGVATTVSFQQLKGILGLRHFTHKSDLISVLKAIFSQTHEWKWQPAILGCSFLFYMLLAKFYSKRKPIFFWTSAMAPLTSVILGSLLVYLTHADNHGVQVIGHLKKGLNPPSFKYLAFGSPFLGSAIKTGAITGIIALAEGVAVGRSFALVKNYHIDGNKEMLAFGLMNIVGSCTSCYLTSGIFSRSAVNFNAGCQTVVSNIIMSIAMIITLLFLIPFFSFTPLVVLSSIIINAMLGLIKYEEVYHLWKVDKFDFIICISSYLGVVFGSVENGLITAFCLSVVRLLLVAARPKTVMLGNIPDTVSYRNIRHYEFAQRVPGILILQIDGPINFACTNYLRERIIRWVDEEEDRIKNCRGQSLQYVILDLGAVGSIDTCGISLLEEVTKLIERKSLKLILANPGSEVFKKMHLSRSTEIFGRSTYIQQWLRQSKHAHS